MGVVVVGHCGDNVKINRWGKWLMKRPQIDSIYDATLRCNTHVFPGAVPPRAEG